VIGPTEVVAAVRALSRAERKAMGRFFLAQRDAWAGERPALADFFNELVVLIAEVGVEEKSAFDRWADPPAEGVG
jgi:hypothetical protein